MNENWAKGKIIFSDFDNTFTGKDGPWRERNFSAIDDFISHGGFFTFATGRLSLDGLLDGYEKIVNAPPVFSQGALIRDLSGEIIFENYFENEIAEDIVKLLLPFKKDDNTGYIIHKNSDNGKAYKLVFWTETENIPLFYEEVYKKYGERIQYSFSCPTLIEFTDKQSTKGNGIRIVSQYVGAETVYAVGDYLNDADMLVSADFCACPENAHEKIKKLCKDNILCRSADGAVADLINRIREDKLR